MSGDWQNQLKTINDRTSYIYKNQLLFDCVFIVGDKLEIKCHKLILAMGSPVFQAMFYGSNPKPSGPICIPDIEPLVFQQIVQYIYGQELQINSYKNAFDLFYGAKKYLLSILECDCVEYLKNNMSLDNVLYLYEFAKFHCQEELEKQCFMEIQKNTGEILQSINICDMSVDTLQAILDLNLMNITSELYLFKAVETWTLDNFKEPTCSSLTDNTELKTEEATHNLLKKLRLLTLTIEEFAEGPANSKLLTDSDKLAILLRITKAVQTPMDNGLCELKNKRKPANFKCMSILEITELSDSRCDGSDWLTSIFKTNSAIDFLGVEIRLQINDNSGDYIENLIVKVSHASSDEHFGEGTLCKRVSYNSKAQIMLNSVVLLEPDKEYALHIFLSRPGMYPIGRHTSLSCKDERVTVTFISHSSWERAHPYNSTILSSIIYADTSEE